MNGDRNNEQGNGRGARRRPGGEANNNQRGHGRAGGRGRGRGLGLGRGQGRGAIYQRPFVQDQNRPRRQQVIDRQDEEPRGNPNYHAREEQRNNYYRDENARRIGQVRHEGSGPERQQSRGDSCMGFKTLDEIARSDSLEIIIKINEKKKYFLNLIESALDKGDIFVLIMEIISKVCSSPFDELKLKLLLDICNSRFISSLRTYLMDLPYVEIKAKNRLYWTDQNKFWSNFIAFCECIIDISPSTALQKCRSLIEGTSKCCLDGLSDRHGFVLDDGYNVKLTQLRERLKFCEKVEKEKVEASQGHNVNAPKEIEPPDDFRGLSVIPGRDDLLERRPFLRPNIINGGYRDTDHYLDVQFRLLREDCFGPLRDGISQYIENTNKTKYDNIRVYHNVKFIEPYISTNKLGEMIQLDEKTIKKFKRINWAHSKRFIFGSLLLFTKDNCRSFIVATILDREVKFLNQGKIPVSIVDKIAGSNIYSDDSSFTMIESEVYFEPYFHVLKALQDTNFPKHLAMKKYIVNVDPTPNPPKYLQPDTTYAVRTEYTAKMKFRVLDSHTWPAINEMGFNESQYEAYRLALTHEFAVIQGPPGTGKTFLGVKIAKTLIENLASANEQCLMLVICYTNHALDQFLENILPVTDSIVRIGGQSRNEAVTNLNLTTLRRTTKGHFDSKKLFYEQRNNLKLAVNELQRAQERVKALNNSIISYNSLKDYVPEVEIVGQYYAHHRQDVKTDPLRHWLFEHMRRVDFNNIMAEVNNVERNDENVNVIFDEDIERIEMILDDFDDNLHEIDGIGDLNLNRENVIINTSFSVSELESKLKTLILLYNKIQNGQKKQELQREIVDSKSRIYLFNEMVANRTRETQLHINYRTDLRVVSKADRWSIYFRWAKIVINDLKRRMKPLQQALDSANTAYEEARIVVDLKILHGIKVVGMTTSGAARLRKLLQALAPPIVIVEEAAEVLEQHIVTSLTNSCEHLILIGDHQQLRPSAAHMRLARHFNIEISLFERMITNGMHSRRLGVQHRMRPEFAALISPHIYADLQNHPTVEQFPNVRGMTDNLFFFTHNYKEEEVDDSSSRSNRLEADMTLKLGNYLVQQGYKPEEVTILAAYSGQMFYMRKQRENYAYLAKVKITVVDNYQGEESKIILLSLVRNNDQNKIGFLGTENRVCVALSRAREGFYIFGNIDILKKNSELWQKIATTLQNNASLGTSIILKCARHPDQITTISSPKDFDKVPEGGCLLKCSDSLSCGHRCPLICHGYDSGHVNTKCYLKCERVICDLGHECPFICSQKCQPCKRLVPKVLPCGHTMQVYCYKDPKDPSVKCTTMVKVKLPSCGHEVKKSCHIETDIVKCPVPCIYIVRCGHVCRLKCHVNEDPDHEHYVCDKQCAKSKKGCTANLVGDRGDHQCRKQCHEACDDCTVEVKKKRENCRHSVKIACCENPDQKLCRNKCAKVLACGHFCTKKCHESCGDCTQKVTKTIEECNHKLVVMCKDPATRALCRGRCERKMPCGHECTQPCNEPCDANKCIQLIKQRSFEAPCGHQVLLPCNVYEANWGAWSDELLLQHCVEPCLQMLACEHLCGGSCSGCRQGRLHAPCKQTCQQLNICGHQCNEPCNQACPPCNKRCATQCPHGRCNLRCGAPCIPCKEPCARSCRHGRCSNRCGEPCSRPPCDEACSITLGCGHRCRGLCGEPCPDICNVCRPDDFPRDFLGDEYDDDVKFIRLQDCTHVLDVENMDNMMTGDEHAITIRSCPFCRTPVINTYRYKDFVRRMFEQEINLVKERVYGNDNIIKIKREKLLNELFAFSEDYEDIFKRNPLYQEAAVKLHKVVKANKNVSLLKLDMQSQYLEILKMIAECYRKYKEAKLMVMEAELFKLVKLLCSHLMDNSQKISQQLQHDVGNEIKRMNYIIQLSKILSHSSYASSKMLPKVQQAATSATDAVLTWRVFKQDDAIIVLKELQDAINVSGIVTKEERDLVVKALGSKAGSWYKCPNGHIYGIDQCGGAMEVSKCADCGAAIGGTNHSLLSNNAHAGEVDGSPFAAWSDAYNNMGNFRL